MKRFLPYCFWLLTASAWSQTVMDIDVNLNLHSVVLNTPLAFENGTVQFSQVRFYLSRFEFYHDDNLLAADHTTAYLVDLENDSTRHLAFSIPENIQANRVKFLLGIDSALSTSGAMGEALDPMHGMYWSWQSGYINCKIEGTFTELKKDFQLHLGGYMSPFAAAQECVLHTSKASNWQLQINLSPLLSQLKQQGDPMHVMSPSAHGTAYSKLIAQTIHLAR